MSQQEVTTVFARARGVYQSPEFAESLMRPFGGIWWLRSTCEDLAAMCVSEYVCTDHSARVADDAVADSLGVVPALCLE